MKLELLFRCLTQKLFSVSANNRVVFLIANVGKIKVIEYIYQYLKDRMDVVFVVIEEGSNSLYKECKKINRRTISYKRNGKLVSLAKLRANYIFYTDPYNDHFPVQYQIRNTSIYAKTCYTVYGVATAENEDFVYNEDFMQYLNYFFSPNMHVHQVVKSRMNKVYGKAVLTGYTKLDGLIANKVDKDEQAFTAIWNPRWLINQKGRSNFFRYKDLFIEYYSKNPDEKFVFRPHPLAFDYYIRKRFILKRDLDQYCKLYTGNCVIDTEVKYYKQFWQSDVLISDVSSLLVEYFYTGKPIIFCPGEEELNDLGKALAEGFYIADNFEEIISYLKMLKNGNDYLKKKREQLIRDFYINGNASKRIVSVLEKNS